jgi:hypothetical protein
LTAAGGRRRGTMREWLFRRWAVASCEYEYELRAWGRGLLADSSRKRQSYRGTY